MVFKKVDIFGHVCNLLLYFCEFGLYVFEVGFEMQYFLCALVVLCFHDCLSFFQH